MFKPNKETFEISKWFTKPIKGSYNVTTPVTSSKIVYKTEWRTERVMTNVHVFPSTATYNYPVITSEIKTDTKYDTKTHKYDNDVISFITTDGREIIIDFQYENILKYLQTATNVKLVTYKFLGFITSIEINGTLFESSTVYADIIGYCFVCGLSIFVLLTVIADLKREFDRFR